MQTDELKFDVASIKNILNAYDIYIDEVSAHRITLDSREIVQNSIFIAMRGNHKDVEAYTADAVLNGACLVIKHVDNIDLHGKVKRIHSTQVVCFFELNKHVGDITAAFFLENSRKMHGIAVTGTNGKTSVAHICASLSSMLGKKSGTIGTMGVNTYTKTGQLTKLAPTINTTPDTITAHKFCYLLKQDDAHRYCIEASSHGLHQGRLQGLKINTAIFTNLTQDHLDYHESMEAYAAAKRKLLEHKDLSSVVINIDDDEGQNWLDIALKTLDVCIYSCAETKPAICDTVSFLWASDLRYVRSGCRFSLESSWGNYQINLPLIGAFNVYNLLASMSALLLQGETLEELVSACTMIRGVPGRMELFESNKHGNVIVDFAHTPDALKQSLIAARQHCAGNLWLVFGCGGDRDKGKRSKMGAIAETWSDKMMITQDNSRNECPEAIVADILQGATGRNSVEIELNRKSAIQQAYQLSHADDLIVVAGKGHEEYLEIKGVREYYNEREYVNQLTSEINL